MRADVAATGRCAAITVNPRSNTRATANFQSLRRPLPAHHLCRMGCPHPAALPRQTSTEAPELRRSMYLGPAQIGCLSVGPELHKRLLAERIAGREKKRPEHTVHVHKQRQCSPNPIRRDTMQYMLGKPSWLDTWLASERPVDGA